MLDQRQLNLINHNIPLIDIMQGELLNHMLVVQEYDESINDKSQNDYMDGYRDCLTTFYTLCYDLVFAQQDKDKTND